MSQVQPVGVFAIGGPQAGAPASLGGGAAGVFAGTLADAEGALDTQAGLGGDALAADEVDLDDVELEGADELELDGADLDDLDDVEGWDDELDGDDWDDGADWDDADWDDDELAADAGLVAGVTDPAAAAALASTGLAPAARAVASPSTVAGARAHAPQAPAVLTQASQLGREALPQAEIVRAGTARSQQAAPATAATRDSVPGPGALAGTLDQTPWLGVARAPDAAARAQSLAATSQASNPALESDAPPRVVLHASDVVRQQVATRTEANVQAAARRVAGEAAMRAVPESRVALAEPTLEPAPTARPVEVDASKDAEPAQPKPADVRSARVQRPGQARLATSQAVAEPLIDDGVDPSAPRTLVDRVVEVARSVAQQSSSQAALATGRPTEAQLGQVPIVDLDHMEVRVDDGEQSFRLSVVREADGLNVELKAPREVVADLRALEPEIEAALAEEGFDLAHFDAQAESDSDGDAGADAESDANGPSVAAAADRAPAAEATAPSGQGRFLNRRA